MAVVWLSTRVRFWCSLHLRRNGLVTAGVVRSTVGEEIVEEHADKREDEDDETPEDLVDRGAVGLDDLNCGSVNRCPLTPYVGLYIPHAIMSNTRTMNPRIPPPVGPCQLAPWAVTGAASTRRPSESWRRAASTNWNIVTLREKYLGFRGESEGCLEWMRGLFIARLSDPRDR